MEKEAVDMLVITAHPDDAEFGVAGTVAQWAKEGKSIAYVVCTNGDKGTSDRSIKAEQLAEIRQKEQRAAAESLGVREVTFLGYSDQGLEDTPEFRKKVVRMIRIFRPRLVVTSDPYRRYIWHRDHRIAGQVTLDAVFPYARDHLAYPDLLEEGLEPHKVQEIWFWASDDINHRCDITNTFDMKMRALKCHESQMKEYGISRVEEWVRARCKEMAKDEKYELAEGFHQELIPF
jgi:LmbE family N-acetylglucosaminyl deacetylase